MSEPIHLMDPSGEIVAVDPDGAESLHALGYTPATPEQIAGYKATEKYSTGGQQAIAGLEGLARGLTARLSTAAEVGLGVDPAGIAGREQAHPATAAGSEGLGIALPLLATLGAAAPAEAAGQGALRGAAELAAPSLIARAGGAAAKAVGASGVAGAAVRGAAEGGLYGVGNVVHEAALGDPNLTAENVLGQVGLSAALGGGLGGLLGAGEAGLKAAIGRGREALTGLADGLATPEKLRGAVQEHYDAMSGAARSAFKQFRPDEIAALITTPEEMAQNEALRIAVRLDEVASNMKARPDLFHGSFPERLSKIRDGLLTDVEGKDAAGAYEAINDAKQSIDKWAKWGKRVPIEHEDAINAVRGIRTDLRNSLENEDLWGEAAARQAKFNEAFGDWTSAKTDFEKEFMIAKGGKKIRPDFRVDAGDVARLSDTASPKYEARREVFDTFHEKSKALLDQIEESSKHSPVSDFNRDDLAALIDKSGAIEQGARKQGAILRMLSTAGSLGPMGGAAAGAMVGGHVGAVVGGAIGVVAKGAKYIPHAVDVLSRLHAHNAAVESAIAAAANGMRGSLRVARGEAAAGIAGHFSEDAEEATARFHKQAEQLRGLAGDPERLHEALVGMTDGMDRAPQTAQALTVTASRHLAFLASKLPPTFKPGIGEPLPHTQSEISRFHRYAEGLGPAAKIVRMAAAGTLTPEHMESLAQTPAKLQQIRAEVGKVLARGDISPRARFGIAMLMGDFDGSFTRQAMARNAALSAPKMQPGPTPAKAGKITLHDRMQLGSRRAASGEER